MGRGRPFTWVLAITFAAAAAACGGGGGGGGAADGVEDVAGDPGADGSVAPVSVEVGPEGAEVALPGGGALHVPPGALTEAVTVTVRAVDAPESAAFAPAGTFFEFGPAGLEFGTPASLVVPWTGGGADGGVDPTRVVLAWREAGGDWFAVRGLVAADAGRITAPVAGFSEGGPAYWGDAPFPCDDDDDCEDPAPDDCWASACVDGSCATEPRAADSACNTRNLCFPGGTCDELGVCRGRARACDRFPGDPACYDPICLPGTGECVYVLEGACGSPRDCPNGEACAGCQCQFCATPADCGADDLLPCETGALCAEGQCSFPLSPPGTPCDAGDPCVVDAVCDADGLCTGSPRPCDDPPGPAECYAPGRCDGDTGECEYYLDTPCGADTDCIGGRICEGCFCVDAACQRDDDCTTPPGDAVCYELPGTCDRECVYEPKPDGTVCDDWDSTTPVTACEGGRCVACEPECGGDRCGDDGCGGDCGGCEDGRECLDGRCVDVEPVVTDVTPSEADTGVPTQFVITGRHLPDTLDLLVQDGEFTWESRERSEAVFTATFHSQGLKTCIIYPSPGGEILETFDVDVNDAGTFTCEGELTQVCTDAVSGLMWQSGSSARLDYAGAEAYCDELSWRGHQDWRLPTISEIRSVVRGCPNTEAGGACGVSDTCTSGSCEGAGCDGCAIGEGEGASGCYWPGALAGICASDANYWSSTTAILEGIDQPTRWVLNFWGAWTNPVATDDDRNYARCVRAP